MSNSESFVVGIDLGTTNFAISVIQNGRPHMVEDSQQNRTFPSAVFRKDNDWLVGYPAKTASLKEPHLGAYAVKRLIGLRYDSEERPQLEENLGMQIIPLEDGLCGIQLGEEVFTPTHIAAQILSFSYELVKEKFGNNPEEVVITVPAYFNHAQRKATKAAAALAGLPCQRIINEPTAAAVAYGMRVTERSKVVVFDLGGGTFDVSILQFASGVVETLAISGDTFLGGEDFDNAIVHYCLENLEDKHGVDVKGSPIALRRLKEACETAKCELSYQQSTMIILPQIHQGVDFNCQITRSQLQALTCGLIDRAIEIVKTALEDASLTKDEIDKVILVGGQTRMPLVRSSIASFFHQDPSKGVHPDEVVAKGAALHASSLLGEVDAPMLFDVTPFNLGIDVQAGLFQTIISKNSRIPVSSTESFVLQLGKQSVNIIVRQGHSRFTLENEFLGEFRVGNLDLRSDDVAEITITFRLDGNGMLHVAAKDVVSGRKVEMKMRNYGEFIREDEDFVQAVAQDKAQIGVGDSSASSKPKSLDVQIRQVDAAPSVDEKTLQTAKEMRGLFAPKLETPVQDSLEDQLDNLNELLDQVGEFDQPDNGVEVELGGEWSNDAEDSTPIQEHVQVEGTDIESEEVFILESKLIEQPEEVFVLGNDDKGGPEGGNLIQANEALDNLLFSGSKQEIFVPQDDFFAGLTAAVTGRSIQDILIQSETPAENIEDDFLHLSKEMRLVLDELFQDI